MSVFHLNIFSVFQKKKNENRKEKFPSVRIVFEKYEICSPITKWLLMLVKPGSMNTRFKRKEGVRRPKNVFAGD